MGFYSFNCAKCGVSVPAPAIYTGINHPFNNIVLITPKNRLIKGAYDGYGRIIIDDDIDDKISIETEIMRDLLDNEELSDRELRGKFFDDYDKYIKKVKVVHQDCYQEERYDELKYSTTCEHQGFFYPDSYIRQHFRLEDNGFDAYY